MIRRTPLKRTALKRKPRKVRAGDDPDYLAWIRRQPCLICRVMSRGPGRPPLSEAAHVGIRGFGRKCADSEAIPLCAEHHRTGPESHHVLGKKFWGLWDLNREEAIRHYNVLYVAEGNDFVNRE